MIQQGGDPDEIEETTWERIGDREEGKTIASGGPSNLYTMKDAGVV